MISRAAFTGCLLLSVLCARAGQTRLEVQRGWGDQERSGRWNPVFVTASDPQPRNVMLELITPHEGSFGMVVQERIAIGPNAQTLELYAPSHYSPFQRSVVVLRDADTHKLLAQYPPQLSQANPSFAPQGPQGIMLGVSGQRTVLLGVESGMTAQAVRTAYLPTRMLPRSPIGYDCIDVLFLNQADLGQIDGEQQQAIVDWVRAGGNVLVTPGHSPVPESGALIAALPAHIGAVGLMNLSPSTLHAANLQQRFAHMSTRTLEPIPSAHPITILDGAATAYSRRLGTGRILLCPFDLADLQFNGSDNGQSAAKIWKPLLEQLVEFPTPGPRDNSGSVYYGYQAETPDQQREAVAINTLCDFEGNVPGAGRFGFSYVAMALIAMMVVVGPVDWFVLRRLGHQSWTWVTTGGWIALITLGAVYAGFLFKSGDLYYRTVRVIDQADDQTVGAADLVGIYSPRNRDYDITPAPLVPGDPAGWWQPAVPGITNYYSSNAARTDLAFHQTDAANKPEPLRVNVWNVRFLRDQSPQPGPPAIEAALSLQDPAGRAPRLVGTIKNLSPQPLQDIRIRTEFGVIQRPGTLAPGQLLKIDAPAKGPAFPQGQDARYEMYGAYGVHANGSPVSEDSLWSIAPDLSGRRSLRINQMIEHHPDFACIYAQFVNPPAAAKLQGDLPRIEQHFQWLRALVRLKK